MTALTPNIAGHQDLSQFASRFVDVEAGRADAQAEDARNRGIEI